MITRVKGMGQIQQKMFVMGYNQSRLANAACTSREAVSKMLSGKRLPSIGLSKRIAKVLQMDDCEFRAMLLEDMVL